MYKNHFHTSDLQHGFKKGLSTITCTYQLDEVVNYYNKNNTKVYALLLDASKAFDRVQYLKLFHTLVDKEMCPLLIRFIIYMYISQTMCVAWRDTLSNHFSVSNGVKQGGLFHPFYIIFIMIICSIICKCQGWDVQLASHMLEYYNMLTILCY